MREALTFVVVATLIFVAVTLSGSAAAQTTASDVRSLQTAEAAKQRMEQANVRNRRAMDRIALEQYRAFSTAVLEVLEDSELEAYQKARIEFEAGNIRAGVTYLKQVADSMPRQEAGTAGSSDTTKADEWSRVGHMAFYDDPELAILSYQAVLEYAPENVEALSQLAFLYLRVGRLDARIDVVARLIRSTDPEARILGYLHNAFLDQQRGYFDRSLASLRKAVQLAEERSLARAAVQARILLASNLIAKGELVEAGSIADLARAQSRDGDFLFEEAGATYQQGVVAQYTGRGLLGLSKNRAEQADQYYVDAQYIYEELSADWELADVLAQRSRVKIERKEFVDAIDLASSALETAVRTNNVYAEAAAHRVLGTAYSITSGSWKANASLANEHFQMGVDAIHGRGFEHLEAVLLFEWATALSRLGWRDAACGAARRSERLFNLHMRDQNPKQLKAVRTRVKRFCR